MTLLSWLDGIGLRHYAEAFENAGVSLEGVKTLDDAALQKLGVQRPDDRTRVMTTAWAGELRELCLHFPAVIAVPLGHYLDDEDRSDGPALKLWHVSDLVEGLLRFAVAVRLAELHRYHGELPAELATRLRRSIEKPTFGEWKDMAVAVARHDYPADGMAPEVAELINGTLVPFLVGGGARRGVDTDFLALRNKLAHGGVTKSVAARLLAHWTPRISEMIQRLAWLRDLALLTRRPDGSWAVLRGPRTTPASYTPGSPTEREALAGAAYADDALVLVRGNRTLALWPMAIFGLPWTSEADSGGFEREELQVYARRGEVRLEYTPVGSEEVCVTEGGEVALEAFLSYFRLPSSAEERMTQFAVRGWDNEIDSIAHKLRGRAGELDRVTAAIRESAAGVLWLTGPAGIGKSCLVARVAASLHDNPPERTMVLPFLFRARDGRCSRRSFIDFALERLGAWNGIPETVRRENRHKGRPVDRLEGLLSTLGDSRVIFILDGLDELAPRDPLFASEIPLSLVFPGVVWLCSGRSEHGLKEAFTTVRCTHVFPDGLPGMLEGDIREMVLDGIGGLRNKLVRRDREEGDRVINPFVSKVVRYAAGLPIYVNCVIRDIQRRKFRELDGLEALPRSLGEYYEKLLAECGIGVLQQTATAVVGLLTLAREPLSAAQLADLLVRGNVLTPETEPTEHVTRGLSALGSMVWRVVNRDGLDGYALYHDSLRQHMETSEAMRVPVETRRRDLIRFALDPDDAELPATAYLYRWGLTHVMDAAKRSAGLATTTSGAASAKGWAQAAGRLTDFDYLVKRLAAVQGPDGVQGVLDDWQEISAAGRVTETAAPWQEFWRLAEPQLALGSAFWPSDRILVQAAREHADDSPLTKAATRWLEDHPQEGVRFQLDQRYRPRSVPRSACRGILTVPNTTINACAMSSDGRVAVSGGGHSLADTSNLLVVWDLVRQRRTARLAVSPAPILCVAISSDGRRIVSGGADGVIRCLQVDKEDPLDRDAKWSVLPEIEAHGGAVLSLALSPDGDQVLSAGVESARFRLLADDDLDRVLAGPNASTVRLWRLKDAKLVHEVWAGEYPVRAVAGDDRWSVAVFVGEEGRLGVCDLESKHLRRAAEVARTGPVLSLAVSHDGWEAITGSRDGRLTLWNLRGDPSAVDEIDGGVGPVATLAIRPGARQVVYAAGEVLGKREAQDTSLFLWDLQNRRLTHYNEHKPGYDVTALAFDRGGHSLVSSCGDGRMMSGPGRPGHRQNAEGVGLRLLREEHQKRQALRVWPGVRRCMSARDRGSPCSKPNRPTPGACPRPGAAPGRTVRHQRRRGWTGIGLRRNGDRRGTTRRPPRRPSRAGGRCMRHARRGLRHHRHRQRLLAARRNRGRPDDKNILSAVCQRPSQDSGRERYTPAALRSRYSRRAMRGRRRDRSGDRGLGSLDGGVSPSIRA